MGMEPFFTEGNINGEQHECPFKLSPMALEVWIHTHGAWGKVSYAPLTLWNITPTLCSQRLVESRRQQILKEFEELHRRLDEEQQVLLSRLEEEEQDILQRLRENAAHLGDKRRDLAHLAAEVEGKCLQSGFEMLKVRPLPLHSHSGRAQSSFAQVILSACNAHSSTLPL